VVHVRTVVHVVGGANGARDDESGDDAAREHRAGVDGASGGQSGAAADDHGAATVDSACVDSARGGVRRTAFIARRCTADEDVNGDGAKRSARAGSVVRSAARRSGQSLGVSARRAGA